LPAHVTTLYDKTPRKKQADVLKTLFEKKGGRWVADPNKPLFKEEYERTNDDFNKYKHVGRPRAVMEETMAGGSVVSLNCLLYFFCVLEYNGLS